MEEDVFDGIQAVATAEAKRSWILRLHISKRELVLWLISCLLATIWGYTQRNSNWGGYDIAVVINSMNVISHVIALGFPIFLGAAIFFARPQSRAYMMDLSEKGYSSRYIIIRRFLEALLLIVLFAFALVLTNFIEPIIKDVVYNTEISFTHFTLFPATFIATIVVMTLLLAIGVGIVLAVENIWYATSLSCTVTLVLAIFAGWNRDLIRNWSTRIFALTSPHNIVKALAVHLSLLSGFQFAGEYYQVMYLGFETSWPATITALALFGTIAVFSLDIGSELLKYDMKRWSYLTNLVWEQDIWEKTTKSDDTETKSKFEKQLRSQKLAAVTIIVIILMSFGFGISITKSKIVTDANLTYYESPEGGEILVLGEWLIIQFSTYHPNGIGIYAIADLDILGFINFPDTFQYRTMYFPMSKNEFTSLNETEQFALCYSPRNTTVERFNGIRSSFRIDPKDEGIHIFVFGMTSLEDYYLNSTIRYHIEVFQQAN